MFCVGSVGMYAAIPTIISQVVEHQSVLALSAFCGLSVMAISIMGGVYSILPGIEIGSGSGLMNKSLFNDE